MIVLGRADFERARAIVSPNIYKTPVLTSRMLSEHAGFDVRLKAEIFQKTGSYKIRGPLNKFTCLTDDQKRRGVICSSAGNHAQGVALAAKIHGIHAVVCMAENATPSKIAATRGYGADVVLHGSIWDEANEKAKELVAGQGTLGLELYEDLPGADVVVVPIGGGGLISGVSMALKSMNPKVKIVGVESSGAPGMQKSVEAGHVVTLDRVDCIIDGLRVKRVGEYTREVVSRFVDEIVTLPDEAMFDAVLWVMGHCKLVVEGAAAAPVAALLHGKVKARPGAVVACVLSGGNVNLDQLKGLRWN